MYTVKIIHPEDKRNDGGQYRFIVYNFSQSQKPIAEFLTARAANAFMKILNGEPISESEAASIDKQLSLCKIDDFVQKKHK